ncbi:hypothetical protein AWN76_002490 [Rhodothermaceae bacterium RA]|nr:hypothetical protein AWN76_002490 [Rhodothermaceae bacterium RA]
MMLFLLVGTRPAVAQHQIHHPDRSAPEEAGGTRVMIDMMHSPMTGMMRHHMQMMQQMMQDPLRRSAMLVHVLPSLQEPLVLSDEQAAQLRQHAQQFKEQKKAHQQQMKQAKAQLQELMASGDAAPERVRAQLEEAARHHAQMQALAYETAEQMKGVLTAEQQATLTKMKPMQLHHHMMMNMTMMEMMQALQPGMMSCGMMQGGMTEMKKNTNGTGAD